MPPGTPYNSFILPYNIRVDDFTDSSNLQVAPGLHLLTHTHTDHIGGLSAKSFGYQVICSIDAKEMLLRHEVYGERALHEQELRSEKLRTFSHLKVDPRVMLNGKIYYTGSRDLLVCVIFPAFVHDPDILAENNRVEHAHALSFGRSSKRHHHTY